MSSRGLTCLLGTVGLVLAGCGDTWLGSQEVNRLPGERISVLAHEQALKPEPDLAGKVALPKPRANVSWPQSGGYPQHAMHHLSIGEPIKEVWSSNIGRGSGKRERLLGSPLVVEKRAFAIDAHAEVSAYDVSDGHRLWSVSAAPEDADSASLAGGGIAFAGGRIFATTGFGQVVALEAETGKEIWRQPVGAPVRSAPTVAGDRVFVVNKDNELRVLSASDGHELWVHNGIVETASLLGGPSPAVDGGTVVVAYSSGELFALRADNGNVLWSDVLTSVKRTDAVSKMSDIIGHPVISRGRVYVVGHSGLTVAVDMRSGQRLWEMSLGGIQQPWIAGNFLFAVSNDNDLVAVAAIPGQIVWVTQLDTWQDKEERKGRIVWSGPVLAGNRLIIVGSHGKALSVSPYTGKILGEEEMPAGVSIPPVVAGESLYFLTEDADLVAYR
ncbi:MAG: PQQ-binding-like beta-propeller repeat protein [Alphaproteobacteria bacterium]